MGGLIKIGNMLIPVIGTVEITGNPTSEKPTVTRPGTLGEDFGKGVVASTGYNGDYYTSGDSISTACNMTGGRTGIHDISGEIVCSIAKSYPTPNYPDNITFTAEILVENNQTELSTGSIRLTGTTNGLLSHQKKYYETRLVAVRYWYPSAPSDNQKRYGYRIWAIRQTITENLNSGNTSIEYDSSTGWSTYISIPYFNRRDSTDLYVEEQDQPDPDEPPFDPSDPGDYNPTIDDTSDTIVIPGNPLIGVSNAGWVHVYNPTTGALTNFGAWLFPNPELPSGADPTEIVNYLLLLCQTLANSRLIDYILDCHIIPVTPQVTAAADIKVGGRTAVGISAPVVTNDYIDVTCGSLNLQEYFGGFQDYLCTKSKLYLPFVGFVDVLPEYWQAGTISVDYKFNVIDGSFMCYVRSASSKSQLNGSIIAQYSGNACVHVPITGVNYANMVSGIVGAAMAVEGAKSTSAVLGRAYSAANAIASGGDMVQSNGYSSAASMMGVRYPYLLIERPVPSYAGNYAHDKGYPSNISTLLSNVSGYTMIDDIDLSGIPLMEVELNELRTLLKEGVYF